MRASGRFAWETGEQANERENAYIYNGSLIATPLPTLTDSIVVSGRDETLGGKPQDTQSFFLNNAAQLYKGLDVNLNIGRINATEPGWVEARIGYRHRGRQYRPQQNYDVDLRLFVHEHGPFGAGSPFPSNLTQQETVTCAYTPVRTMYLFASVQRMTETGGGGPDGAELRV